ncbi:hypothetical protein G6N82_01605 [Altererythrobacter sp. BO-6]|uniref:hypothetical protein n=1 Tax=Altererythrobacter sp. BO-6 TaxID=2604537 RepID=UPI0013E1E8E7|nr:hypothetical protein [Altererythrobacter sp. BO-6]QIG53027.1 hypothetical protein G6N82_01605 [Altererythrobacter sp. BO-6]
MSSPQPPLADFSEADSRLVATKVSQHLVEGEAPIFFCGEPIGLAIHSFAWDEGLQEDRIGDGYTVFTEKPDGTADIIWYGTSSGTIRTTEDGGNIRRLKSIDGRDLDSWLVDYPRYGISENFAVLESPDGELFAFQSTFKLNAPTGQSARLFRAKCKRA